MNPTQTLKDMLNISGSLNDSFVAEDRTPTLVPSASKPTIASKSHSLSEDDLIELNIGNYARYSPLNSTVNSSSRNQMEVIENGNVSNHQRNALRNNTSFVVPLETDKSPATLELTCPSPGDGDVSQCTNSSFCKISKLVDYNWEKIANVNVLAVCRTKPLIAYVIDPVYHTGKTVNIRSKNASDKRDTAGQVIRFVNYEKTPERALIRTTFTAPIADIAFAYKSINDGDEDKVAVVDKRANVNIFSFKYVEEEDDRKLVLEKILEVVYENQVNLYHYLYLKWCPFVPVDDDYEKGVDNGMRLAVSIDNKFEVMAVDRICRLLSEDKKRPEEKKNQMTRSELEQMKEYYQSHNYGHQAPIIAIHLSNDATVVCTASLDNTVKFFELSVFDTRMLHHWLPTLPENDPISCFNFLDDYNYLLENSRHHFWGYVFIGTRNGHISIWDLGNWIPIQKIAMECDDCDTSTHFEYKVDITSRVITAVRGGNAFVFLLDFIQNDNASGDQEEIKMYPRIMKIGRFQLYNSLLSFSLKRQNENEVDLFWVTQKSLERCSIDLVLLSESDEVITQEMSLPRRRNESIGEKRNDNSKLSPQVKSLISNCSGSPNTLPSVTLAEMFSKTSPAVNSTSGSKFTSIRRSSTPSEEVANLFQVENDATIVEEHEVLYNNDNRSKPLFDELLLNQLISALNSSKNVEVKFPENLVREEHLKSMETSLLSNIRLFKDNIANEFRKVTAELEKTKIELKEASHIRNDHFNKIVNGLVKKLMEQMNTTVSRGLDEFITQVKTELCDVSTQVNKLKESLKTQCESQKQQQLHFERSVTNLSKQIEECNSNHRMLLRQVEQQMNTTQQLANAMNRSNSAILRSRTPQNTSVHAFYGVNDSPNELMSIRAQEELEKKRMEEERAKQMNALLKRFESNDKKVLHQALVEALNTKESALITKICNMFEKNPDALIDAAAKDQAVLLSFLNHLSLFDLEADKGKVKFLSLIAPRLDIQLPMVRTNLKTFLNKLVAKLDQLSKKSNDPNVTLMQALFKSYLHQI